MEMVILPTPQPISTQDTKNVVVSNNVGKSLRHAEAAMDTGVSEKVFGTNNVLGAGSSAFGEAVQLTETISGNWVASRSATT